MIPLRAARWLLALMSALSALHAETWQTNTGQKIEGNLKGIYGPIAVVGGKTGSSMLLLETLRDEELGRVADFLAKKPAVAAWAESGSDVARALKGKLQVLHGEKLVDFDPAKRPEPDFYLVYFGAEWCPPCRAFSPKLVAAYEQLKKISPDAFEVVFVSSDEDSSGQLKYAREVKMPWPVLRFSQRGRAAPIERWAGKGIPCLVVVTREGDAIFHSYKGEEYVGPSVVLEQFESLLRALDPKTGGGKRANHRLAVAQHRRATGGGSQAAAPYLIALDPRRYQTLKVKELTATLDVNERGEVTDVAFEGELPAVLRFQLEKDAGTWLFLPLIENGQPRPIKVKLPLKLGS